MPPESATLVLFNDGAPADRTRMETALRPLVRGTALKVYRTPAGLRRRLCRPGSPRTDLVLLCPASVRTLQGLKNFRDLLAGAFRVVLVLPNREPETIAAGHGFFPRYMGYADGDLTDVFAVLARLLGRPMDRARKGNTDEPSGSQIRSGGASDRPRSEAPSAQRPNARQNSGGG
jgi:hypothetical protein